MGGIVKLLPVTHHHLLELARTMRPPDVAEVRACGMTPLHMLMHSSSTGENFTATFDGEVAAIFGVSKSHDEFAWAWVLTGAPVDRYPVAFVRTYRQVVRAFLDVHAGLKQLIDARYVAALRVAQLAGFTIFEPIRFGPQLLPFRPVYLRRA